ncbi:MAG: substrate-binding domain-containing protein [Bacillota bacterium]|nr:substrate-binding domain-containing protein [Bacillota bacterium]
MIIIINKRINIGVLTKYVENFYFGALLKGIHNIVVKENANMYVVDTYMLNKFRADSIGDLAYFPISLNQIDGWIILPEGIGEEYKVKLLETGKPVVLVAHKKNNYKCSYILDDNYESSREITEHLIEHGHKRIAFAGCLGVFDMKERLAGYIKTMVNNGLFDKNLIFEADNDNAMPSTGRDLGLRMLNEGIEFTAVLAANDFLAFGMIEVFKERDIDVPNDIAVIGYDNTIQASSFKPGLTSMSQNIFELGNEAGKTIFRLINNDERKNEKILIKSNLVIRSSCGCKEADNQNDSVSWEDLRTKDSMIRRLEAFMYKNSDIGTKLLTMGVDEIIKLIPEVVDDFSWICIGLFKENTQSDKEIIIQEIIDKRKNKKMSPSFKCSLENFPSYELMPDYKLKKDDVIWIVPISTEKKDIGVISYISEINKENDLFAYDAHMVIYNLLGIAIDRDLATKNLKNALETLQQTQEQLIESEKMVSLGSLVTGFAHEINNPIGVGVTATTFMENNTNDLMNLFNSGKLSRVDLEKYLEKNSESIKILTLNLQKASNFIKSFKQIAVDNSIDEKRTFKVKEYINDVILSLNPKLRKTKINIRIECPDDLELKQNPGELSQIITNLVLNSIHHGYDDGMQGKITIQISSAENSLNMIYMDDGKGIDKGIIDKIFEPFFTTKRNNEGSGLGLNIIYNIITQKFGGSISCESELGSGATFIINFPIHLI